LTRTATIRAGKTAFTAAVSDDSPTWTWLQLRTGRGRFRPFGRGYRRGHRRLAEPDRGSLADSRSKNAVEVVPVLLEDGAEARGASLKTAGFFEELPGRCFLTFVAASELFERDLLPSDEDVEAGHLRRHVSFPALLRRSLPLDAAVEVLC
jgi:hypothetical protein